MSHRALARPRAQIRPNSPLKGLASTLSSAGGAAGRRCAVVAASTGLILTLGLPAANAAPAGDSRQDAQQQVTVPADAPVSFAGTALTSATPPAPVAAPAALTDQRASRSSQRQSLAVNASAVAAPAATSSELGSQILAVAGRYVGVPYRFGGTTPSGFDCSGYTQYVYGQVGISLPRTSGAQAAAGRHVSAAEARPGDLVYTSGHVGIYAGGNMMYDAGRTGLSVSKRAIWFSPTFIRVG